MRGARGPSDPPFGAGSPAMPPAKAGGKEALVLQCEWDVCTYVASKMEEFCEHVSQHLQQHLPGKQEDEMDPLGKEQPRLLRLMSPPGYLIVREPASR